MSQKLLLIVILAAAVLGGYFLYQNRAEPSTVINPQGYSGPPPLTQKTLTAQTPCSEGGQFCNFLESLKQDISNLDFLSLSEKQKVFNNECKEFYMRTAVCKEAKEGEIRASYSMGAQDSESNFFSQKQYIQELNNYFKTFGSFSYHGTMIKGEKAAVVYFNRENKYFLILNLEKYEDDWRIHSAIKAYDISAYEKLTDFTPLSY